MWNVYLKASISRSFSMKQHTVNVFCFCYIDEKDMIREGLFSSCRTFNRNQRYSSFITQSFLVDRTSRVRLVIVFSRSFLPGKNVRSAMSSLLHCLAWPLKIIGNCLPHRLTIVHLMSVTYPHSVLPSALISLTDWDVHLSNIFVSHSLEDSRGFRFSSMKILLCTFSRCDVASVMQTFICVARNFKSLNLE